MAQLDPADPKAEAIRQRVYAAHPDLAPQPATVAGSPAPDAELARLESLSRAPTPEERTRRDQLRREWGERQLRARGATSVQRPTGGGAGPGHNGEDSRPAMPAPPDPALDMSVTAMSPGGGETRDEGRQRRQAGRGKPAPKAPAGGEPRPAESRHTIQITPQQPIVGDQAPKAGPRFGPDGNVIEGQLGTLPITTSERQLIQKLSPRTRRMLEDLANHPNTAQALKDAGITHIRVEPRAGAAKPKRWTMAHSDGALIVHSQSGNEIERDEGERKHRGPVGILHHEAGHGVWDRADKGKQQTFRDALAKHPEVTAHVAKIVNIKPLRDAFHYDEAERANTEVHAELQAMRHYDPGRFAALPPELKAAVEAIRPTPPPA
jgi:hypothetical protein